MRNGHHHHKYKKTRNGLTTSPRVWRALSSRATAATIAVTFILGSDFVQLNRPEGFDYDEP